MKKNSHIDLCEYLNWFHASTFILIVQGHKFVSQKFTKFTFVSKYIINQFKGNQNSIKYKEKKIIQ